MIIYSFLLSFLAIIFSNSSPGYNDINLTINVDQTEITDTLFITLSLRNNSAKNVFILNRHHVKIGGNPAPWSLSILYQDSIAMISYLGLFIHPKYPPIKKSYLSIRHGDEYIFTFYINFTTLLQDIDDLRNLKFNTDYGEYSLQLTYKDPFRVEKRALREKIESNIIRVIYKE